MTDKIYRYILTHDDRWSFIIAYVSLAVILAIAINLFWLVVVVALHGLFEWIKQGALIQDRLAKLCRVLWELKFDIGLVFFGLALEVYMGVILGVAGLGATARAGVQAGSRAALWQSILRATLLSVDDAAQVVRLAAAGSSGGTDGSLDILDGPDFEENRPLEGPTDLRGRLGPWVGDWAVGDYLSIGFGVLCVVVIALGPYLTPQDWSEIVAALGAELHPWPWLLE